MCREPQRQVALRRDFLAIVGHRGRLHHVRQQGMDAMCFLKAA